MRLMKNLGCCDLQGLEPYYSKILLAPLVLRMVYLVVESREELAVAMVRLCGRFPSEGGWL